MRQYCDKCCPPDSDGVLIFDNESYPIGDTEIHKGMRRLKLREDGKCIYLNEDNSCSIYINRPIVCRQFICDRVDCDLDPKL